MTDYKELLARRDAWKRKGTPVKIIECTRAGELWRHYPGQTEHQPCYIEIDLRRGGVMFADYDSEIGNAVPESVRQGFERRYVIPCLTGQAANRLMEELAPLASRMIGDWTEKWNSSNNRVVVLGEDAQAAEQEIAERLGLDRPLEERVPDVFDPADLVDIWDLDAVTNGQEAEDYGITAETTDDRLKEIAREILKDLDGASGVAVCHGLGDYLMNLRDEAQKES